MGDGAVLSPDNRGSLIRAGGWICTGTHAEGGPAEDEKASVSLWNPRNLSVHVRGSCSPAGLSGRGQRLLFCPVTMLRTELPLVSADISSSIRILNKDHQIGGSCDLISFSLQVRHSFVHRSIIKLNAEVKCTLEALEQVSLQ